jgi:hypothetical protein
MACEITRRRMSAEKIPGGIAANVPASKFDPVELERGIAVEMEHTTDRAIAEEIAKDHLAEDPDYYKKLEKMEGEDRAVFRLCAARPRRFMCSGLDQVRACTDLLQSVGTEWAQRARLKILASDLAGAEAILRNYRNVPKVARALELLAAFAGQG